MVVDSLRAEGVFATIERLDYNLLTLRATIGRTTFAASEQAAPFFSVDQLSIDLPWSVVTGPIAVESIEIIRPTVTIARGADGRLNLPELTASDEPSQAIEPIDIGRLFVSDLVIGVDDNTIGLSVDGRAVSLDMSQAARGPLAGRLAMDGGVSINYAGRETAITRLNGGFAFNGSALTIDALVAEAPEAQIQVDGVVDLLVDAQRVDLRYQGRALLERMAPWVAPDESLSGAIDFSGTAAGPLDAPQVTLEASGQDLAWRDQRGMSLALKGALSDSVATVERLRLTIGRDGSVDGRARVALAGTAASSAEFTWTDLDLGSIARTAGVDQVRVASRATGRATAEWTGSNVQTARATIETSLRSTGAAANTLALSGGLSAALARGQWSLALDALSTRAIRLDGRVDGALVGDHLESTTVGGRVRAEAGDLRALVSELKVAGVDLADPPPLEGGATIDLAVSGTFASPSLSGTVKADGLDLDGNLDVDLNARRLRGALRLEVPRLSPLAAMVAPDLPVEGAVSLNASLGGTLDNPRVQLTGGLTGLEVAGQQFERAEIAATFANQVLQVQRLEVIQRTAAGRLDATGSYSVASGRYAIDAKGRDLAVRPVVFGGETMAVGGQFDLNLKGEGTLDAPHGAGTVDVRDLVWDEYVVGVVYLDGTIAGNDVGIKASVPSLPAVLNARASLSTPRLFTADMAVTGADLQNLLRAEGPTPGATPVLEGSDALPVSGAVTAFVKASGDLDRLVDAKADFDLRLIDVVAAGSAILLDRPARLRYDGGTIVADDVALRIGKTTLTATGRFGEAADASGLTVRLNGGLADFLPFAQLAGFDDVDASGGVSLELRATGNLDAPRIDASLSMTDGAVSTADLPPVTGVTLRAVLDEGVLTLSEFGAVWQGATLSATGTVPVTLLGDQLPAAYTGALGPLPDRARAQIKLDSVTAALAAPFVDPETLGQLAANLTAVVAVEATALELDAVQADVTLDRASFAMAGIPLEQERPTKLKLAGGRLEVVDWMWSGAGNRLAVTGGANLAGASPEVQAALAGSLDLKMLGAVSRDIGAGGRADFDIRATGPVDDPDIAGEITFRDGELAIRDPRLAVTEMQGTVTLTADTIRIVDLEANANGGTLRMSGDVRLDALVPTGGAIAVVGRGIALEVVENLRSEVDLDLTLRVSDTAPELTGKVTVLRGSYRAPISLTGQLLSGVEVVPAVAAEPTLLDRLRLSVSVVSQEGIVLDNNYGQLEIGTDLRIVGTAAVPAVTGRLAITEGGEVYLAGQTWRLERGTVDFTNSSQIEPILDLLLTTRVQRYEIQLAINGTPETLEANLSAPGGLSQADAVSLLLTGQVADDQAMAQTEIARGQLLLLLSGELLGFAGRAVGLDSAQVGRGLGGAASDFDLISADTDPSARLTVSKQLKRDVELVFSQSLRDNNDLTWIAIYRPLRVIELRATTQDNNARTYEFRHELNIGGRATSRNAAIARAPEPRVSAVRWAGSPGFAEAELRGRLKLTEGDRFDFYRWQQDRDRLAAFYHDRGYFEVRIRATRDRIDSAAGEPTLALIYNVERGPATSIVVEGATLSGRVVSEMKTMWQRALFDGFLREDLEGLARQSLAEDGYLQAQAAAEIHEDEAGGAKQIVVRLTPGTGVTNRRLEFEGQAYLSADALEKVLREQQLLLTAWLRPAEAAAALAAHYRSIGFQSAAISIGTPVFVGTTATLVVAVTEGPRFQIADITVTGVAARPIEDVRKAFGLEAGAPYLPASLEVARRDVEIGYHRLGYNDVRVSVRSVADPDAPSAHITLAVDEGRQQILREVSVTGARTTTTGTIDRALDLTFGEPADINDTYRAQKRLYDTGAFRRADVTLEPIEEPGAPDAAGPQPMRAVVELAEVQPYRFRYGVRLTDDTGPVETSRELRPGVVADLLRRNLFGRAITAGLAAQAESDRRLARGILSMPRLFGLPVTSSLFLTQSRQDFTPEGATPFVEDGSEITAEQRFRPRPTMAVSYNYRFKRTHIFETSAAATDFPLDVRYNIARLTGTFAWDTRDDPFDAHRGWFRSSGVEYAGSALGSDLRFVKFIHQQFFFTTVNESVVLASAFRLGAATGFGEGLLASERFFAGGGTSVRGFAEDGLGGVDFLGSPVGGASSLVLNQEVRFPIYKWVRGVGFVDAGNVFRLAGDTRPFELEVGAGFGLRIDTPFGLARIDYGMPLTRRGLEPFGRWYFTLGQAF